MAAVFFLSSPAPSKVRVVVVACVMSESTSSPSNPSIHELPSKPPALTSCNASVVAWRISVVASTIALSTFSVA